MLYNPIKNPSWSHNRADSSSSVLMFITKLVLTHSILMKQFVHKRGLRREQPGPRQCTRRKGQEVFQGGIRPHIAVMAGCTSSCPGLQGIPLIMHWEEGRSKTHTRSFTEHTQLPPSKVSWAPMCIPKGYAVLETTKETRNWAPLPISRLSAYQKEKDTSGLWFWFWFFCYGPPPSSLTRTTSYRRKRNSNYPMSCLGRRCF